LKDTCRVAKDGYVFLFCILRYTAWKIESAGRHDSTSINGGHWIVVDKASKQQWFMRDALFERGIKNEFS
jgi:hypothetical protein